MSTYKEIVGQKITKVSSDPGEPKTGQMWYNSTTGTLRGLGIIAAYSSSSPMVTKRRKGNGFGAVGSFNIAGGEDGVAGGETHHESYNGTGWTTLTSMPVKNADGGGAGTTTAGLVFGGNEPPGNTISAESYEWDGSSWTAGGAMSQARRFLGCGTGSQTSALAMGGSYPPPSAVSANTSGESYNGTSWSGETALPAKRRSGMDGLGATETEAMQIAGNAADAPPNSLVSQVFIYDGSAWSAISSLSGAARQDGASAGTTTAALVAGGNNASTVNNLSEEYDGTSWTTASTLGTARDNLSGPIGPGSSASPNAVFAGGNNGTANVAVTEEYNKSINTITAAAWASGGAMNTARAYMFGVGTQTAALGAAGYIQPFTPTTNSEEYDGTSWTEGNNVNTGRYGVSGFGIQTAAVAFGGDTRPPGTQYNNNAEHYDGTSWTNATAYPVAINFSAGAGSQTAGVAFGGAVPPYPPGRTVQTTEYDGSSWTTSTPQNLNTGRSALGSAGTQTAAIGFGGDVGPGSSSATETYNGSTWTSGGALITAGQRNMLGGGPALGSTTDVMAAGSPGAGTLVENYNGTSWSTRPSLATGRNYHNGAGNSTSGIVFGGSTPPYTTATEEFTGETETANVTDFSTE